MFWNCTRLRPGRPADPCRARAALTLILIPVWLASALIAPARAATNVSGSVRDVITEQPLPSARISVTRAGAELAAGVSEADGVFQLFIDIPLRPEPLVLNLSASKTGYVGATQQVIVTAGRANQLSYRLNLTRNEASNCSPNWARTVVVGHVRPPTPAAGNLALSQRIGEVLQYDLLAEVQKTHLPPDQQPLVLPCPDAQPRSLAEHPDWARVLKADAFLVGTAEPVDGKFRVDLQVSGRHGARALPVLASTPPLNLDRPQSADLGRAAMTPIVHALLRAYLEDRRYAECVEFANAAQRVLGPGPTLLGLRQECQASLPNNGLLISGGGQ